MKAAILVNGVPASGKSTVSRAVARRLGLPLMALDTIKEPLFSHLGGSGREHNRKLGRASYEIIFATIGDWPAPATVVIDAWFGFQPLELLERHLSAAGITSTAELWCHAPGSVLAERYAARCASRSPGHPGLEYVPELVALSERATPIGRGPCLAVDTTRELPLDTITTWLADALGSGPHRET
jgi:glucokinase